MPRVENGSLLLGRLMGVPVRIHWTAPVGAFVFTGMSFVPERWAAFFALILLHEMGHALVVKAVRAEATGVELTGYGGYCQWRGDVSPVGRAAIAWGGVWAQMLLLLCAEAYVRLVGWPGTALGHVAVSTALGANLSMIVFNLVPLPPLDGSEAWPLPYLLGQRLRARLSGRGGGISATPAVLSEPEHEDDVPADRQTEVEALVSSMLEEAKKEPPP